MTHLPENAVCYKRTALFTPKNLPEKFKRNHHTKAGVWGQITVERGVLQLFRYAAEDEDQVLEKWFLMQESKLSLGLESHTL